MKRSLVFILFWPLVCYGVPTQITSTGTNVIANQGRQIVRNSLGSIYVVVATAAGKIQIWGSANDGTTWTEQDSAHEPSNANYIAPSIAVDATDLVHIAYYDATLVTGGLRYATFYSTGNTFGIDQSAQTETSSLAATIPGTAVAVDSNNKPHVSYVDRITCCGAATNDTIYYTNKVSGSWSTKVREDGAPSAYNCDYPNIIVDNNNLPVLTYFCDNASAPGPLINAEQGNLNAATSFTTKALASGAAGSRSPSVIIDGSKNTWVCYANTSNQLAIVQHKASDSWATWQSTSSTAVTIADRNSTVYSNSIIFNYYSRSSDNKIAFDPYYSGSWTGESIVESSAYNHPSVKWSYYYFNQPTKIDYVIDNGTNVFFNKLATLSVGVSMIMAGD